MRPRRRRAAGPRVGIAAGTVGVVTIAALATSGVGGRSWAATTPPRPDAASSVASTATIAPASSCVIAGSVVAVAGAGFAPGSTVTVSGDGVGGSAIAGADGAVRGTAGTTAPSRVTPLARAVVLTATDGTATAQATLRLTTFTFSVAPAAREPTARVTWRVSGFTAGSTVYAHYVHEGHQRRRVRFGRMPDPCGVLRKRVAMLPLADPPAGRWRIQLDGRRAYRATTTPRLRLDGRILRRGARSS
jgi:hypothetical protein